MGNNSSIFWKAFGIAIMFAVVYQVWYTFMHLKPVTIQEEGRICTMDAQQCPDGSYVGRTGPNCEFVCPVSSMGEGVTKTIEVGLATRVIPIAEPLTVLSVIEDSRCPTDVQCIQAGTVRLSIKIESGMGTATEEIGLGKTITTETEFITLMAVTPERVSTKNLTSSEYRFLFRVSKR